MSEDRMGSVDSSGTPRVVVNCANARDGGAISVAVTLVQEAFDAERYGPLYPWARELRFVVSPQVFGSLTPQVRASRRILVADGSSRKRRTRQVEAATRGADVVYTVFAPWYGRKLAQVSIAGFADGQWVNPRALAGRALVKYVLRWPIAGLLYRREDALVHQTQDSLDALRRWPGFRGQRMTVAPNCLNPQFVRAVDQLGPRRERELDVLTMIYVARYYPYKNHLAVAEAQALLAAEGIESTCLVTMSDAEWDTVPPAVRRRFQNVGILHVSDLAQLYAAADLAVFPSLNESFSAAPIEALSANGLLVAADRDYVRKICDDVPVYVEPDGVGIADGIRGLLNDQGSWASRRERARSHVAQLPDVHDMVGAILGLIDELAPASRRDPRRKRSSSDG